jgi:hypothetical protein
MGKFNHLNVPNQWQHYWTKYPEGYTILEALLNWVAQVDNMVDNQNQLNDTVTAYGNRLDDFIEQFDDNLQTEVTEVLSEWQQSGFLDVVISEALQTEIDTVKADLAQTLYEETVTVRIPTDYPDLQSALDEYSKKRKVQGKKVILMIELGHALTKGLQVRHGDYRNFEIQSENPITYLDPYFVGAQPFPNDPNEYGFIQSENSLIMGVNADMPALGCIIDMENKYGTGYFMYNSTGLVKEGCGVINAGLRGCHLATSHIDARGTNFSGATNEGFRAQHGCTFDLMGSNFDNCCKDAIGEASIYISKGAFGGARELTAQNSGTNGIKIRRSKVDIEQSDFSGAKGLNGGISGCGIIAEGKADVSATGAIANNCKRGIYATQLSQISGGITAKNSVVVGGDILVYHGSVVMGGETTKSAVSGLYPDPSDTNLPYTNIPTGNGTIISQDQANLIAFTTNANGSILKFGDGTMFTVTAQKTVDVVLAVGEISAPLVRPTRPTTFSQILYSDLHVWGKSNAGGGGNPIGVDVYGRFYSDADAFRVKNSGAVVTSTAINTTLNSVQYLEITYGRWK